MKHQVLGAIFARGGSKGIPRKNTRIVGGKPLVAHAIEVARSMPEIDRVILSTDDSEIAELGRTFGAEVPFMRPQALALDESPEWAAWQHAIEFLSTKDNPIDVLVSLPPTAPLRSQVDVSACISELFSSNADLVITVRETSLHPDFNMVHFDQEGYAHLVGNPKEPIHRRQGSRPIYGITTVAYAARADYVLESGSMFEGKVRAVAVPADRAIDIDTDLDLTIAEFLFSRTNRAPRSDGYE